MPDDSTPKNRDIANLHNFFINENQDFSQEQKDYFRSFLYFMAGSKDQALQASREFLKKYPFSKVAYLVQELLPPPALDQPYGYELAATGGFSFFTALEESRRDLSFLTIGTRLGGYYWGFGLDGAVNMLITSVLETDLVSADSGWRAAKDDRLTTVIAEMNSGYRWEFGKHYALKPKIGGSYILLKRTIPRSADDDTSNANKVIKYSSLAVNFGLEFQFHPGPKTHKMQNYTVQFLIRQHFLNSKFGIPVGNRMYLIQFGFGGIKLPRKPRI